MSICLWRNLYGGRFDYFVCADRPVRVPSYVEVINQQDHAAALPPNPRGCAWKLYPPRLRPGAPEVVVDNDVVVWGRLPQVDELIDHGTPFITEGYKRNFGRYDRFLPPDLVLNSGLYGLPAGYDFGGQLSRQLAAEEWDWFDEQGLVAYLLNKFHTYNKIPASLVQVVVPGGVLTGSHGAHFCGINGPGPHPGWHEFKTGSHAQRCVLLL